MRILFNPTEQKEILKEIEKDIEAYVEDLLKFSEPKEMTTLEKWTNEQAKFILERKRQAIEDKEILILREQLMESIQQSHPGTGAQQTKRAFESILSDLNSNVGISKEINKRSMDLAQRVLGTLPEPTKESEDRGEVGTSLIDRLGEINRGLCENLLKISENLDRLENAIAPSEWI